uniref:NF-kappa-B inhibitor-like protein 1 n=1 Tax=Neogobius melanostomus TaxID=47308 RepID=A0A8C6SQ34_9GOBI
KSLKITHFPSEQRRLVACRNHLLRNYALMVSHRQKRVWKYIEEGSLLKLKSYLKRHHDIDVNYSQGRRQRSPLHLACGLGDDGVLRLLLQYGASVLLKDRKGDTALHIAANRCCFSPAYDDLVVPLQKSCAAAMFVPNRAGVTPDDLLNWMNRGSAKKDSEREWMEKILWGLGRSYQKRIFDKKHAEAQRLAASYSGSKRRKTKEERADEEKCHKEHLKRLQREHEEYLSRATRKEEEVRQGKKRCYEERCAATFQSSSSAADTKLSYSDIPWPAPRGTVQEMVDVMMHGVDKKDTVAFRKVIRKQQTLWHPDKFAQRCATRLEEKDRQRILDTVTALSQELNRLTQSLNT